MRKTSKLTLALALPLTTTTAYAETNNNNTENSEISTVLKITLFTAPFIIGLCALIYKYCTDRHRVPEERELNSRSYTNYSDLRSEANEELTPATPFTIQ